MKELTHQAEGFWFFFFSPQLSQVCFKAISAIVENCQMPLTDQYFTVEFAWPVSQSKCKLGIHLKHKPPICLQNAAGKSWKQFSCSWDCTLSSVSVLAKLLVFAGRECVCVSVCVHACVCYRRCFQAVSINLPLWLSEIYSSATGLLAPPSTASLSQIRASSGMGCGTGDGRSGSSPALLPFSSFSRRH